MYICVYIHIYIYIQMCGGLQRAQPPGPRSRRRLHDPGVLRGPVALHRGPRRRILYCAIIL